MIKKSLALMAAVTLLLSVSCVSFADEADGLKMGKTIYSFDFDTTDGATYLGYDRSGGGSAVVEATEGEHGSAIRIAGNAYAQSRGTAVSSCISEIMVFEDERLYIDEIPDCYLAIMVGVTDSGESKWITNYWISPDGMISYRHGSVTIPLVHDPIEPNTWHNVKILYNIKKSTHSLYLDGEAIDVDRSMAQIRYIGRIKIETGGKAQYYDNLKCYCMGNDMTLGMRLFKDDAEIADLNSADYLGGSIRLTFSEKPDISTIAEETVKFVSDTGEETPYSAVYENGEYIITPDCELLPNTEYSIRVSGSVESNAGIPLGEDACFKFRTIKKPFSILSCRPASGKTLEEEKPGTEIEAELTIQDRDSTGDKAGVFVGIYKDNALYCMNYIEIDAAVQLDGYRVKLMTPADISDGGYMLRAYMVDSASGMKLIDTEES